MASGKASVRLGGVALAASAPISWSLTIGTTPYSTVMSVHKSDWPQLKGKLGQPLTLDINPSQGRSQSFQSVYILYVVPSDSPNRVSFLVADLRWQWGYKLIVRDFNMTKKSGDVSVAGVDLPREKLVTIDDYDYKRYSLNGDTRWTAKEAVEDVLELLMPAKELKSGKKGKARFAIDSWPIEGDQAEGSFTLQNTILRDQGDAALARLLSYIPGAEVHVDPKGMVRIFDGADLSASDRKAKGLTSTWDGDKYTTVDRSRVRPSSLAIHYQREVELMLEFDDDMGPTTVDPLRDDPYVENVIPTVDDATTVWDYDPVSDQRIKKVDVPPGTWVPIKAWLAAMDLVKPKGSVEWTFDTLRAHWIGGNLDEILGAAGGRGVADNTEFANVMARLMSFRKHFRQTFRINRRYMERIRDIKAFRVGLLDPVTGKRMPSTAWGEYTVVKSLKGQRSAKRKIAEESAIYKYVDTLKAWQDARDDPEKELFPLVTATPSPAEVSVLDRDLGLIRVSYINSPYGTGDSIIPSKLVNRTNQLTAASRNVAMQDEDAMGEALRPSGKDVSIFLKTTSSMRILMTIFPSAPNNKKQFHVESVSAEDVSEVLRKEFRIQGGTGPVLEVFIPPGEVTARFAWGDDDQARATTKLLLGLNSDDPNEAGLVDDPETPDIDESKMNGFTLINKNRELKGHSVSVAAESLAPYADSVQGRIHSAIPSGGMELVGNSSTATILIEAFPSGKISAVHDFPGRQRSPSRLSLLPEDVRRLVLGTLKFTEGP